MPLNQLFFQQFNTLTKPQEPEVFARTQAQHAWGEAQLFVIGSSHHLSLGSIYSERLSCETNLPAQLEKGPHNFKQATTKGLVETKIWQETFTPEAFPALEKDYLTQPWDLVHCFFKDSAFTGIRLTDHEIFTIHSYPESSSLVFTRTQLP